MKSWLYYSAAAAIIAAPVGWIFAGVLEASRAELLSTHVYRPLYQSGHYEAQALFAAVLAASVVLLVGAGRHCGSRSMNSSTPKVTT